VQVGGVLAALLRGPDADEVHLRATRVGDVGAEPQTARGQRPSEEILEARLVERGLRVGQDIDLVLVHVDADDVMTQLGHRGGMNRTEVPTADDRDPQDVLHSSRRGSTGPPHKTRRQR
jgi:hypothetical protein